MIRKAILRGILAMMLAAMVAPVWGQYYDWGRSPAGIRWMQAEGPRGKVVFPDYYRSGAAQVLQVLDTISSTMGYGFRHAPLQLPIVLHTQNFEENGIVLWAPKRMELKTIAPSQTFATPWLKQLVAHESRHTVQYGNLYKSWFPPIGWFVGQQAGLLSLVIVPLWMLEGDAVQTETQMSSFGRALQPSFTIEYRAYAAQGTKRYAMDKWFCGSYKDFIPDHYQLGYQLTAWSRERYGDDIWDRIVDYGARHPYTILTTHWALRKYYRTSMGDIFKQTFADLKTFWDSLPPRPNSAQILATPTSSYTVYEAPMICNDTTLLALKRDMDRPRRIVRVDPRTGSEKTLFFTGYVLTPPVMSDSVLYWSEYRSSMLWDERVNARVCTYDLRTARHGVLRERENALYPTPLGDGRLATVGYDYSGRYRVDLGEGRCWPLPQGVAVHGMARDSLTGTLAMIVLEDQGMSLCRMDLQTGDVTQITRPSRVSINNLRGGAGLLTFNSIASGFDEVHLYDLRSGEERRVTTSRYGSFSPGAAVTDTGELFLTTYTPKGYQLSRQRLDTAASERVVYTGLPENRVNPSRRKWPVINLDTVRTAFTLDTTSHPVKRFRKGGHLFNLHSWAPWSFDPFNIVEEDRIDMGFGATVMSQDLLSSTTSYLSYGYSGRHRIRGGINYSGLAPKFSLEVDYGGGDQLIYGGVHPELLPTHLSQRIFVDASVSLPLQLSSGYHLRSLTPVAYLSYQNSMLFNQEEKSYSRGFARGVLSLYYVDNVRMAVRDLQPRWGYALKSTLVGAPFRNDFGRIVSFYGRVYTPGLLPHHGLMLRGSWQYQPLNTYNFYYKELYPRGANYDVAAERYGAFSADYNFPLCYPDGGINSIVYFNRIRLNFYYDYARFGNISSFSDGGTSYPSSVWSYGGEITFDMRFIRMPKNDTSLGIYIYKPSDRGGVVTGVSLQLPL